MKKIRALFHAKSPGQVFQDELTSSGRVQIGRILFAIILFLLVLGFGRAYVVEFDFSIFFDFKTSPRVVEFVFAFFVAITSSLLASFIFVLVVERRERKSLNHLEYYAPTEFYRDFVNSIAHYQGIIRYDHNVDVTIRDHPTRTDILLCDLDYRYLASRLPRTISLKIFRMATTSETEMVPLIADECLENEFVWHNAEYDFSAEPSTSDYNATGLEVGSEKFELKKVRSTKSLIHYECNIDKNRTEQTFIKYRVTIPIETETILTITSEFITKNSQLKFDYSSVSKEINPCIMAFAGIKENILFDDDGERKILSRRLDGWLLPRNGWVISWWRDDNT